MELMAAYEAILSCLGSAAHAARVAELRRAFEARTGAFAPEDAWFEVRSRAFWDDALTKHRLGEDARDAIPEGACAWLEPLARAQRGLYSAEQDAHGTWTLVDELGGAEYAIDAPSGGLLDELSATDGWFDGRVVARAEPSLAVALLPGVVFHPLDATPHVERVIQEARAKGMLEEETLDFLLTMERNLRSLSRVKASYAYRLPK